MAEGDFPEIADRMSMKIRPKFNQPFLFICKIEKTWVYLDKGVEGVDVAEDSKKRTMYRHFPDIAALANFYRNLKLVAKVEKDKGITTKLSPVTAFIQDDTGQVIGVEKYGDYGLQEFKVGPGDKDE